MKNKILLLLLSALVFTTGCKKKDVDIILKNLGWYGTDNPASIPQSINTHTFNSSQSLPASVDLSSKFPPVGDQGQYGTCVAWATGYGVKTVIDGMDRGLTTSQLTDPVNQFSPKDLFTALPDSKKGADCNGTNFTDALDLVLSRGVATMQTVPYTNLGNCAQSSLQGSWTTEANGHKIQNYRRINLEKNEIKSYLSNNQPVLFGAKLADNFMQWNSDDVISSNTSYDQVGQHAYHAMTLSGYDDGKGPNGAFLVQNSWGTAWGSQGKIWVDYNFFVNEFCFGGNVFIATNDNSNPNPPAPDPVSNGYVDLAPWAFTDVNTFNATYPTERYIEFNVYNIGDQNASASTGWALYYLYYNAYNANDYGFLIVDIADNSIPYLSTQTDGNGFVHFNADIAGGSNLANDLFSGSTYIYQYYYVPNITGYYYLCLYADPLDVIQENDESNNYFYTTDQYPITFNGGVGKNDKPSIPIADFKFNRIPAPTWVNLVEQKYRTTVNSVYPNAYSMKEIKQMIKNEKKSGRWQQKLNEYFTAHPEKMYAEKKVKPVSHE